MVEQLQLQSIKPTFPQLEIPKFDRILFIKRTYTGFKYVRLYNQNMMRKLLRQRFILNENL